MQMLKRTWAEISLDALDHNYRVLTDNVPAGTKFLGVVKADGYGHGAVPVARELERTFLPCRTSRRPSSCAAAA